MVFCVKFTSYLVFVYYVIYIYIYIYIYEGADKSLARPGTKKTTATKLGIYSTYSPRSSIHFLSRCSKFASSSKKNKKLSVQPGLRGSDDLRIGRKMATCQLLFYSREQEVFRRGHIRRIGWVIKKREAQIRQFLLGCKCPVSRDIIDQEQGPFDEPPAEYILQKILQLHQQRWVELRFDSLAIWKIMNDENTVLIPKNRGEKFSSGLLHSEFFGAVWAASSWIWSIISGVVTVLGRPGRGATQVEKSPRLNWTTQFLTVAYDGAFSPNVSVRMVWISLDALPCGKKKTWWQLASRCCWNCARRVTCFFQPL